MKSRSPSACASSGSDLGRQDHPVLAQPREVAGILAEGEEAVALDRPDEAAAMRLERMACTRKRPMRPAAPATTSRISVIGETPPNAKHNSGQTYHIDGGAAPPKPAFSIDLATKPNLTTVSVNAFT